MEKTAKDKEDKEKNPQKYGGFLTRLFAFIIDAAILGIVASAITMMMGQPIPLSTEQMQETPFFQQLMFILSALYFIYMPTTKYQASFGKYIFKLKIIDQDGNRLTVGRSVGRYLGTILSGIIFYIGFLMIAFTSKNTGLHDMLAKTYVVKR
ncbi:hypothetical protein BHF68_10540 [Desulfuribacillus alkaliarsenatis]|uniref:RDD domain-containing protein n=1 Tax=Desulfuribacillus alkaliarsenatis TaxID=766136 RepID=A0A1E5FZF0_9FIRM|nr:hypothetical protein BHF68_10540 [Desulfuribacillus alkaliarsenatis]